MATSNGIKEKKQRVKPPSKHFGVKCKECQQTPIIGKCHRCVVCKTVNLCDACFNRGAHSEHAFDNRMDRSSPYTPSTRAVPAKIPQALIDQLQSRDLSAADYDLLLNLDTTSTQGSVPLHIVNSFPTERVGDLNCKLKKDVDECSCCGGRYKWGEVARRIPCGHRFHQSCIDRWLLQSRSTCPLCGVAAFSSIDAECGAESIDLDSSTYKATPKMYVEQSLATKTNKKKKKMSIDTIHGTDQIAASHPLGMMLVVGQNSTLSSSSSYRQTLSSGAPASRSSLQGNRRPGHSSVRLPPIPGKSNIAFLSSSSSSTAVSRGLGASSDENSTITRVEVLDSSSFIHTRQLFVNSTANDNTPDARIIPSSSTTTTTPTTVSRHAYRRQGRGIPPRNLKPLVVPEAVPAPANADLHDLITTQFSSQIEHQIRRQWQPSATPAAVSVKIRKSVKRGSSSVAPPIPNLVVDSVADQQLEAIGKNLAAPTA